MTITSEPARTNSQRLFGLDFVDADHVAEVVPEVLALVDRARGDADAGGDRDELPLVVTPNVDQLVRHARDPGGVAAELASRAAVVLPDGQPIVWAGRLLGAPLRARLPGSNLVPVLLDVLVREERTALVVASSAALAARVERQGPTFRSIVAPRLDVRDPAGIAVFAEEVTALAREHRPEFLFVTLGHPKQEMILDGVIGSWPSDLPLPVMLAVGQSFDMHYGMIRRAPVWMQRWGLEWFFRFVQEPRRLFRRYFVDDPWFLGLVVDEWRARRRLC